MFEEKKENVINKYYLMNDEKIGDLKNLLSGRNTIIIINQNKDILNILSSLKGQNNETEKNKNENEKQEIEELHIGKINKEFPSKEQNLQLEKLNEIKNEIYKEKNKQLFPNQNRIKLNKNKTGRKRKLSSKNIVHSKYSYDNILRKIKVKFSQKLINFINHIILEKYNNKIRLLKPLIGKISQNNTINFNKELLYSKLKDIFSLFEITSKFKKIKKNYNKSIIRDIYKKNIQELIDILEMNFLEVFKIFRDVNETEKLKGLEKIDSVIEEMSAKEDDEKYINMFIKVVLNFENYYFNKRARKSKKSL